MHEVLKGVRVLEVAQYVFVPTAGGVLAEWGADVVKVEHPVGGDAYRGLRSSGPLAISARVNYAIEHANRGKRSIGIDLATCLLYTSPSPRDQRGSRMPSSA